MNRPALSRLFTLPLATLVVAVAAACAPMATPAAGPPADGVHSLVVMGTTDVHGWLLPHDYFTGEPTDHGLSLLAPIVDSIRAAHPGRTALVDSGDLLQGNPLAYVFSELREGERHPIIATMDLMRYDAAAIGNHEFNFGIEHLDRSIANATTAFVSANIFRHGTGEHAYTPYVILDREIAGRSIRVGITGATPPGVHVWDRVHVEGRLEFRDIVESVRPVVARMRAEGADVVLVAAHSGLEGTSYDTLTTGLAAENVMARVAHEIPGIDAIFLGHTHRELADTTIGGVLVLQARNWARSLAVAHLEVTPDGDGWRVVSRRGEVIRPDPATSSQAVERLVDPAHRRALEYVTRPIGTSIERLTAEAARVRTTAIIDYINHVQRQVAGTDLSAASAFNLSAEIPEGPVTVADIARLYVYDNNTLMAVRISGAQLREYLEKSAEYYLPCADPGCERVTNPGVPGYNFDIVTGVSYTLDISRPVGQRVVRLEREGRPVRADESFTLALNNYRQGGGGGFAMLSEAPVIHDRGESIRDLLVADLAARGTLRVDELDRSDWRVVPESLAARAVAEQTRPDAPR
jgi:2',3'-cyclic-nucleotide 2'-phosphodiesterase (5'-nucleotidase family)